MCQLLLLLCAKAPRICVIERASWFLSTTRKVNCSYSAGGLRNKILVETTFISPHFSSVHVVHGSCFRDISLGFWKTSSTRQSCCLHESSTGAIAPATHSNVTVLRLPDREAQSCRPARSCLQAESRQNPARRLNTIVAPNGQVPCLILVMVSSSSLLLSYPSDFVGVA